MSNEQWERGDAVTFIGEDGGQVVGHVDEVLSSQLLVLDTRTVRHVFVFKNDRSLKRYTP